MRARLLLPLIFVSTVLLAGNMTVLAVTAPIISADLGASPTATTWMVLGYLLVTATMTVAMGQLSDLWEPRRLFFVGLVGFAAGSVLLALVSGPWWFVAVRTAQGLAAAVIIATAATIIVRAFPGARLAGAMGSYLGGYAAAQVVAPPLGGVVADTVGWRWMFIGSAVIAVAACLPAPSVLRSVPAALSEGGRFDLVGNLVFVVSTGALLLAATAARESGWSDPGVLTLLAVTVVSLPLLWLVETRAPWPVIDVGLLRDREFVVAVAAGGLIAVPRVVPTVVLAVLLQGRYGVTATSASVMVLALAAGVLVGSLGAGRLAATHGVQRVLCCSALVSLGAAVVVLVAFVWFDPLGSSGRTVGSFALGVLGLATGAYSAVNGAQILARAPQSRAGSVNALRTTAQSAAIAVGTAVLLSLLGTGLGAESAAAFFSGEASALDPRALAALDRNTVVTLGVLIATVLVAVVFTLLLPAREGD